MTFKIFEISKEWIDNASDGATSKLLGNIEALDLAEAVKLSKVKYPNRALRVVGDKFIVEFPADAGEPNEELIRNATKEN